MKIREYGPADRGAVRTLVGDVLVEHGFARDMGGVDRDLADVAASYGGTGARARGGFWIAEEDGVIVGTVAIRPKRGTTCELKRLYLRADKRGTGLGQRLYAHAEAFARAAGYESIWLDSSRRFARAHALYARNGFVLVESLDNEWEDDVYEKRLVGTSE
jgi:GNAT superfamily N-acetyltransferase